MGRPAARSRRLASRLGLGGQAGFPVIGEADEHHGRNQHVSFLIGYRPTSRYGLFQGGFVMPTRYNHWEYAGRCL